jgi:hypothetical protein
MDLAPFLTSAVVAALVAGLVTLRSTERKIQIENTTQERAKWREKIRATALLVHQAATAHNYMALSEHQLVFALLLNPHDSEDAAILTNIAALRDGQEPSLRLQEFAARVSFLLKHDWERAKEEAKPWLSRSRVRSRQQYELPGSAS